MIMGVVRMYRCGYLVGVVVRRYIYIDFLIILLIPILVVALFCSSIPTSLFIFKMFICSFVYIIGILKSPAIDWCYSNSNS